MGQLRRVEAGLGEVPGVEIARPDAARLRRGQALILRGRDAPAEGMALRPPAAAWWWPSARSSRAALQPYRVFNLPF